VLFQVCRCVRFNDDERMPSSPVGIYANHPRDLKWVLALFYYIELVTISAGKPVGGFSVIWCSSDFPQTATNVYSTSDISFSAPMPTGAKLQTMLSETMHYSHVFANFIPVRWQTADSAVMLLLGSLTEMKTVSPSTRPRTSGSRNTTSSVAATSSAGGEPSKSATRSLSSAATASPASFNLSPGAIAGVVIGSIGVIALLFAGWALVRIQRHKLSINSPNDKTSIYQDSKNWTKPELDGRDAYVELEAPRMVSEVSTGLKDHSWEMSANSRPSELG
jgi:hypothetical protein